MKLWTCNDALVPSSTALHCLQPLIRVGSASLARKDIAQLFQWHLKVFPGQHVPPAKHPGWQNTSRKASWMPIPPQLAPLYTEEQQFYTELLALSLRLGLGPTSRLYLCPHSLVIRSSLVLKAHYQRSPCRSTGKSRTSLHPSIDCFSVRITTRALVGQTLCTLQHPGGGKDRVHCSMARMKTTMLL